VSQVCPRTVSYKHQRREFHRHRDDRARMLLWQMRTGKTKAMIDLACYLYDKGEIDAVLVTAPNGVHLNWILRELPKHHWFGIARRELAWSTEESHHESFQQAIKDFQKEDSALCWLTVNVESMHLKQVKQPLKRLLKGKRYLAIADEVHLFGRPGSKWSRAAQWFFNRAAYKRGLTGTVVGNRPLQAYSQFRLLKEKGALGADTYDEFKQRYAEWEQQTLKSGRSFPAVKAYRRLDELAKHIAKWSSQVLRSDCEDMPTVVESRRFIELTAKQKKAYQALLKDYRLEAENGEALLDFIEGGARMVKLQQILSGYVVDDVGEITWLVKPENNPRVKAILDELEQLDGRPVIVWARFSPELEMLGKVFRAKGYSVAEYHGQIPERKRQANLASWLEDDGPQIFLGQPGSGGVGLDLSRANDMIYFSHTPDAIIRNQSKERATKKAGEHVGLLDLAVNDSVDTYILDDIYVTKEENADLVAGRGLREVLDRIQL
jgi:SNF2 family DNA or RNA helicase